MVSDKKSVSRQAVTFEVRDLPGKEVCVAGSFNDWQPVKKLKDKNGDGVYRGRIMLPPGEYQYKFLIDGEWRADAANPNFTPNSYGSLNSVFIVDEKK